MIHHVIERNIKTATTARMIALSMPASIGAAEGSILLTIAGKTYSMSNATNMPIYSMFF